MKQLLLFILFIYTSLTYSQSAELTPVRDSGMHTVAVTVPAKYSANFTAGRKLKIPANYTVSVYHAGGLNKPRFMAFSPAGVLHISDMTLGKVFALPDLNQDGVADTIREAATGFSGNHDVKFYKGAMYVTETTRIFKCTDANQDGFYETKTVFINNLGNNQTSGHVTRTVVFDSINKKVYVSVGSSCNVCRETARAIIEIYDEDGTNRRVFASGVRNAVGMAMHPVTNRLWANNNGSDQQGNEIPPEWIDIVRDNGFYGHPFVYGGGVWFNFDAHAQYQALKPITAVDSAKVATVVHPAALIRAHTAPMALEFLTPKFGPRMQHGFLTALRGSWNTTNPNDFRGYKVIYGHLSSDQDTTIDYVSDFCSGFITDTINRAFWGRPVGLAIDDDGKVYISSDEGGKFILVMTPDKTIGIREEHILLRSSQVYPNPAKDQFSLSFSLTESANIRAVLMDVTGKEVMPLLNQDFSTGTQNRHFDIKGLTPGCYFVKIVASGQVMVKKLIVTD